MQNKLQIEEQLRNFLQLELRLLTTPCIIIESEKLGSKLFQTVKNLKALQLNRCGHEKNPLTGANCIKSIVKQNHYVVATQDRDLQASLRRKVGVALMYLHKNIPIIDEPSDATKKFIEQNSHNPITTQNEMARIVEMKKKVGLIKEPVNKAFKKKKKPSGPNPLSCKKKKPSQDIDTKLKKVKDKTIKKKQTKPNVLVKS